MFSRLTGPIIGIESLIIVSHRLDQILGRQGSKAKDVYDSKQSLASRIVKTERQVYCFLNAKIP